MPCSGYVRTLREAVDSVVAGLTWLVLFDVDGTLLLTHDEVYVEASRLALEAVLRDRTPMAPTSRATRHRRTSAARFAAADVPEAEIDAGLPRWCETFSELSTSACSQAADTSHWQLAPARRRGGGCRRAPRTAHRQSSRAVAHARMERLGLAELFPRGQGAFGCEREDRVELFDLARERAGNWPRERTVAVGDTPLDVSSAHAAGCRCIGVTTGSYWTGRRSPTRTR